MSLPGCDTGFGNHLAKKLHSLGFTVFAGCLQPSGEGGQLLRNLDRETGRLHVVDLDVTSQVKMDKALQYVDQNLPKLGLWGVVNNAGLGNSGFLEWISVETCEKVKRAYK